MSLRTTSERVVGYLARATRSSIRAMISGETRQAKSSSSGWRGAGFVDFRCILLTGYNKTRGCQVAGRKKQGNLAEPIGVRFDRPVLSRLQEVVQASPMAKDAAVEVVRVITTWWLMQAVDLKGEFEQIASEVHEQRKGFADGVRAGERLAGHGAGRSGRAVVKRRARRRSSK